MRKILRYINEERGTFHPSGCEMQIIAMIILIIAAFFIYSHFKKHGKEEAERQSLLDKDAACVLNLFAVAGKKNAAETNCPVTNLAYQKGEDGGYICPGPEGHLKSNPRVYLSPPGDIIVKQDLPHFDLSGKESLKISGGWHIDNKSVGLEFTRKSSILKKVGVFVGVLFFALLLAGYVMMIFEGEPWPVAFIALSLLFLGVFAVWFGKTMRKDVIKFPGTERQVMVQKLYPLDFFSNTITMENIKVVMPLRSTKDKNQLVVFHNSTCDRTDFKYQPLFEVEEKDLGLLGLIEGKLSPRVKALPKAK